MSAERARRTQPTDDAVQASRALARPAVEETPRAGVPGALEASLGEPGRPLDPDTRGQMEGAFGRGFSDVRVHAGASAAASARALGARAYTLGSDIAFGEGRYQPATAPGRALIAHELAHVVQRERPADPGPGAEARADAAAGTVAAGGAVDRSALGGAPGGVARQAEPSLAGRRGAGPGFGLDPASGVAGLELSLSSVGGFAHGGAAVPQEAEVALNRIAAQVLGLLTELPAGRVTLTGHTDLTGTETYNKGLGLERARNVGARLFKLGVPATSIDFESAGMSAPVVATDQPEVRNRRVEVRFQGRLLPQAESRFGLGGLRRPTLDRPDLTPGPGVLTPRTGPFAPPFPTQPIPAPQPRGTEGQTKAGSGGDALKALLKTDAGKRALEAFKAEGRRAWEKTTTGEKIAGGATAVAIAAPTVAGLWSDPAARATVLNAIDGAEVDVPEVPGLKVRAVTKGQGGGAVLMFDLSTVIRVFK
jgi:outer membrane protein OmpA-like peptidoglycan-associated protein